MALYGLSPADTAACASLVVRTIYDLRTAPERESAPDPILANVSSVVADVIGDTALGSPAQLRAFLDDPVASTAILRDGRAAAMWVAHYRDFVRLESACDAYGRLFRGLADAAVRPVLVHCSTGKDRTGWAAAALLLPLGVPEELVVADFLLSNARLAPLVDRELDQFPRSRRRPRTAATDPDRSSCVPRSGAPRSAPPTRFDRGVRCRRAGARPARATGPASGVRGTVTSPPAGGDPPASANPRQPSWPPPRLLPFVGQQRRLSRRGSGSLGPRLAREPDQLLVELEPDGVVALHQRGGNEASIPIAGLVQCPL